jgi:hypothetical protein
MNTMIDAIAWQIQLDALLQTANVESLPVPSALLEYGKARFRSLAGGKNSGTAHRIANADRYAKRYRLARRPSVTNKRDTWDLNSQMVRQ